jgi:hypothetical protein
MSDPQQPQQPAAPPQPKKLQIQVDQFTSQGVYSNMMFIHSNDSEFTLDFLFVPPTNPVATVRARVISSPRHIKRFLRILEKQVDRWETMHGEIDIGPLPPGEPEGAYH